MTPLTFFDYYGAGGRPVTPQQPRQQLTHCVHSPKPLGGSQVPATRLVLGCWLARSQFSKCSPGQIRRLQTFFVARLANGIHARASLATLGGGVSGRADLGDHS